MAKIQYGVKPDIFKYAGSIEKPAEGPEVGISRVLVKPSPAATPSQETRTIFLPRVVLDIREVQLSWLPNSIFFPRRGGDSNPKVSQTQGRRRTKMTHF